MITLGELNINKTYFSGVLLLLLSSALKADSLNDTGISYRGHFPKGIQMDCKVAEDDPDLALVLQQDCATGKSANLSSPKESVFQYQKVDKRGEILPSKAKTWHCVVDQVSGLMWEVKNADVITNPHHINDKFTWYHSHPKHNGGNIGQWNNTGEDCHGFDLGKPRSYCNIEQFASRTNKRGLCGFNDWRVPTREELTSLIHFGQVEPAIDEHHFPHTLNTFYWTHNPLPGRPIEAWSVDFEFGTTSPMRKTDKRPVRLVRTQGDKNDN